MTRISYLNDQFIDHDKAFIHIEDRAFQFGDGVYEVIFFHEKKFIDFDPHMNRLVRSLDEVKIKYNIKKEWFEKIARELFEKNGLESGAIYIQVTRGRAKRLPQFPVENVAPTLVMSVSVGKTLTEQEFESGISMVSYEDIRWKRCDIKTVCLLAQTMLNQKAKDEGFDDALLVRDGIVGEASYSNFFIVDVNGVLITKSADNTILQGITRNRVIKLAEKAGITVLEKDFSMAETLNAVEAFTTSSTLTIRPVTKIDGALVGDGKVGVVTRKLNELYQQFIAS